MLSRGDFVFTIGYDGASAIVDGRAKRQYGKLSTMELAEEGPVQGRLRLCLL